ncbi:hypothetical protein LRAMOSA08199 [Lichtheimia ramosa]|uniref:Enkurin domain-containing protein n=1 Tax=Lichtheimia ramosa TaxID=688394 RepID=A0A077WDD7_9FUNG|nr:hypothetical protein LRAMOSA08199 [Lichtheimia ramosa]
MSSKSSTPKFWKKLGLGKKSSAVSEQHTQQPPSNDADDDKSVKSKRLSGFFPHKRQSMGSLRARPTPSNQPSMPSLNTAVKNDLPPSLDIATPEKPVTPPPSQAEQPEEEEDKQQQQQQQQQTHDVAPVPPKPTNTDKSSSTVAPTKTCSSSTTPSRLARPRYHSNASKAAAVAAIAATGSSNNNANIKSTSSSTTSSSNSSSSSNNKQQQQQQSPSTPRPTPTTSSTRLRKPSQIPGAGGNNKIRSQSSNKSLNKKQSAASLVTSTKNVTTATTMDESQPTIQSLLQELEKERSIVKVLQGQKEAVTKDLDYFSQMLDDLMEEKESLQQKYEEEKEKNKTREQDLDVLMDKLKMSNNTARDKSYQVDQWKSDIEQLQKDAQEERDTLKETLKQKDLALRDQDQELKEKEHIIQEKDRQLAEKDHEIDRLKTELAQSREQISLLRSTMDQLMKAQALNHQHQSQDDTTTHQQQRGSLPPSPSTRSSTSSIPIKQQQQQYNTPQSSVTSGESDVSSHRKQPTRYYDEVNELDRELLKLTKEKEKLQSDYSKIPLSGGGPMSRRRKEELEEMLDEVDSQLSRVKQKIRRS